MRRLYYVKIVPALNSFGTEIWGPNSGFADENFEKISTKVLVLLTVLFDWKQYVGHSR